MPSMNMTPPDPICKHCGEPACFGNCWAAAEDRGIANISQQVFLTQRFPPTLADCDHSRHVMAWDSWYSIWTYEIGIMENGNVGFLSARYPYWTKALPNPSNIFDSAD